MVVGIIGGSGLEKFLTGLKSIDRDTPYGLVRVYRGEISGVEIVFVPRHGPEHEYPPHKVNYRGNLYALVSSGVDKVIATSAVGSLNDALPPGSLVLIDQFIDFTKRNISFYDDVVVHVDVTKPYCIHMNRIIFGWGKKLNIPVRYGGTYVCTEGPRFETSAEINMFRMIGADVVGMTNVPEVVLAREIGVHYSLLSVVTNYAAGMQERVSQDEVVEIMAKVSRKIVKLISASLPDINRIDVDDDCIQFREYASKYVFKQV
jgi:5'-methylthioadenosine phosphorylase